MRSWPIILLFFLTSACAQNRKDPVAFEALWTRDAGRLGLTKNFVSEMKSEQDKILSVLTGHTPMADGQVIGRRWDVAERKLTRQFLSQELAAIGIKTQEHSYKENIPMLNKQKNPATGTNLYAILPATVQSDEYIVLGAHYDTVDDTPGASDNASGCALVYAVAKAMMVQETRNKNLLIVFFDKEEVGHAGAYAFAKFLKEKAYNVHSVHTADQVGWDSDGDRNIELEIPTPYLKEVYRKHARTFDIKAYRTNETGSDHKELREAGFKAVGITEEYRRGDTSPHHHNPEDTYDTIDFDYLAFVSYLVFKVLTDLMND